MVGSKRRSIKKPSKDLSYIESDKGDSTSYSSDKRLPPPFVEEIPQNVVVDDVDSITSLLEDYLDSISEFEDWNNYDDDILDDEKSIYELDPETTRDIHSLPSFDDEDEDTHAVILHRYSQELNQINSLRNQAIFIITALGFLVTSGLGVIGADWFSLTTLNQVSHGFYISLITSSIVCGLSALSVIFLIEIIPNKLYWKYPTDAYLERCTTTTFDISQNKRVACSVLADITLHNAKNNKYVSKLIYLAGAALLISLVLVIIILVLLFRINYSNSIVS